ncbi:MAG: hypothetical protein JW839_20800 [Candidatus Lokiarchaeota archaeon]|nr:hypothetical protein [Candidatus Lokiarchaeota archaeon]
MRGLRIREKFAKHFQDSDLSDLFRNMCDMVEGTFDPWEKVNDLDLRFYEFDEDEFDFDNWLINAGQFVLTVKAHVMLHKDASTGEVGRLCEWFQDTLDSIKDGFLGDERHYYYSFSTLSEFLKFYVQEGAPGPEVARIEAYMGDKLREVATENQGTRHATIALVVPYVLDAVKIHPDATECLLRVLDRWLEGLSNDTGRLDESLGLCVRTLAFKDYATPSPDGQFAWALERSGRISDSFIGLTSSIHLAIGHSLRGEKERAEALLAAALARSEPLPSPKKEVHIGFLMRGCIEAGILSGTAYDGIAAGFQQVTGGAVERIRALNDELGQLKGQDEQDDGIAEEKIREMETVFVVFSGILDNLAMAGVHTRNPAFLGKVEALIEQVQEVNVVINFSSKLAPYYRETGDGTGKSRALVAGVASIIDKEVENVFLEDLFDFFIEFSRDALDLAYHEQDPWYVEQLEAVFSTIKLRKNLDDDDLETLQYQLLSAMNATLTAMWNDHFGTTLLQGFSGAID